MVTFRVMEDRSDELLLERIARERSHAAFAELVNKHAGKFRQLAFRFLGSKEDAEDMIQDAFLKLWRNPELWSKSKQTRFTTWFYRVIVNQCLDEKRKHKPLPILDGVEFEDKQMPVDEALSLKQRQMRLETAFQSLPEPMQASLNLNFYEAVPHKQAAEIMGMSVQAFQSLLMRAKTALKDAIAANAAVKVRRYDAS